MAARFVRDPEIGAGPAPFGSMRREASAAGPGLGEKMCQLVAQGPVNFRFAMRGETAIEQDARPAVLGPTGRGAEPG